MTGRATPGALLGRWIHSHEEDSATEKVMRPATFAFPPSRGRAGFELRADGSFVDISIAAADGLDEAAGTWQLEGDGTLVLSRDDDPGAPLELRVKSVGADRLVIDKTRR